MIKKIFPALLLLLSFSTSSAAVLVEKIVAIVNTEIVLESDFRELREKLKNPTMVDESLVTSSDHSKLKTDRKVQLEYLINEKLMEAEIKKLNLSVTSERVQQEIRDMAKRNGISPADVLQSVKAQGLSASDYQAFLKAKIERQSLLETEIISKLRITDDDAMSEYLKRNPSSKTSVNEFTVAHIFFNPKKGSGAEALARAQKVYQMVQAGEKFETLAEQFSEDPNFTTGGLLGTFKTGEFLPEIEASIQNLSPSQVTNVVKSRMGFHIVRLISKKITTDSQFEKEKPRIVSDLMEKNFQRQLKIWLQTKREEAFVRINEP